MNEIEKAFRDLRDFIYCVNNDDDWNSKQMKELELIENYIKKLKREKEKK